MHHRRRPDHHHIILLTLVVGIDQDLIVIFGLVAMMILMMAMVPAMMMMMTGRCPGRYLGLGRVVELYAVVAVAFDWLSFYRRHYDFLLLLHYLLVILIDNGDHWFRLVLFLPLRFQLKR